eukprot:Skav230851  [mRNA]  locus=scaffold3471:268630:274266:+ [translate_table: standard]
MARLGSLLLVAACALMGSHFASWLFTSPPTQRLRGGEEGCQQQPSVFKTNDWDQPEIQYSTGASNQVNYITPVVQSDDIKAWLSLNVNFFSIIGLATVGGLIEIQRFFPDALYW